MQSASKNQCCYCRNQPVNASSNKASNSKNLKTERSKPKTPELKASNSNNSSCPDPKRNAEIFDKAWKEKKKHWKRERRDKKDSNPGTPASEVNTMAISVGRNAFKQT